MTLIWRTALSGIAACALSTAVMAQETEEAAPQGPVWLATCSNQSDPETLACSMSQTMTMTETGQRLLAVTVQPGGDNPNILLSLPHGLSFGRGVGVATDDGAEERFPFTTADASGTYARIPLTDARLEAMRKANALRLNIVGVGGRELNFEISLAGFSKTYDLIR